MPRGSHKHQHRRRHGIRQRVLDDDDEPRESLCVSLSVLSGGAVTVCLPALFSGVVTLSWCCD